MHTLCRIIELEFLKCVPTRSVKVAHHARISFLHILNVWWACIISCFIHVVCVGAYDSIPRPHTQHIGVLLRTMCFSHAIWNGPCVLVSGRRPAVDCKQWPFHANAMCSLPTLTWINFRNVCALVYTNMQIYDSKHSNRLRYSHIHADNHGENVCDIVIVAPLPHKFVE